MTAVTRKSARDEVLDKLARLRCDPISGLARIAMQAEMAYIEAPDGEKDRADLELARKCYSDLAGYIAPKLKSVEVTTETESAAPITIVVPQLASGSEKPKEVIEKQPEPEPAKEKPADNIVILK